MLAALGGPVIADGPFAGMTFTVTPEWDWFVPYVVGRYECELWPVVEEAVARCPRVVVDIGCADGYYAVGLARRLPHSQIVAFDIDEDARRSCQSVAELNGVDKRITLHGLCTSENLEGLCGEGVLLLCDCEGAELELLSLEATPALRDTTMLVELHDFIDPVISTTIAEQFSASHEVTIIDTRPRHAGQVPTLRGLSAADQLAAMDEGRPGPMQWAFLKPRRPGQQD